MRNRLFPHIVFLLLSLAAAPRALSMDVDGERVLQVFTWKEYFDAEAIRLFESSFKCRVEFSYYDSNETMVAAIAQGGGYDVMTPTAYIALAFASHGLLRELDHALLPNLAHLDRTTPALTQDPEMRYSVPYTLTILGVGYNRRQVPESALGGWRIFTDSRFFQRMTMVNDVREILGAGLKCLGHSLNTSDPEEVRDAGRLLVGWKKNLAAFEVDKAFDGLLSGKYAVVQAYDGDIAKIAATNPDIGFYVPREGSAFNSDNFVIASDAAEPELAHAFINHFLDPDIAVMNMRTIFYTMPNATALDRMPQDFRNHDVPVTSPSVVARCEVIRYLGDARQLYDDVWESVLMGK